MMIPAALELGKLALAALAVLGGAYTAYEVGSAVVESSEGARQSSRAAREVAETFNTPGGAAALEKLQQEHAKGQLDQHRGVTRASAALTEQVLTGVGGKPGGPQFSTETLTTMEKLWASLPKGSGTTTGADQPPVSQPPVSQPPVASGPATSCVRGAPKFDLQSDAELDVFGTKETQTFEICFNRDGGKVDGKFQVSILTSDEDCTGRLTFQSTFTGEFTPPGMVGDSDLVVSLVLLSGACEVEHRLFGNGVSETLNGAWTGTVVSGNLRLVLEFVDPENPDDNVVVTLEGTVN